MNKRIISEEQALQILKNDLRKQALDRYPTELNNETQQRRAEIMAQIDREIQEDLRRRRKRSDPFGPYLH